MTAPTPQVARVCARCGAPFRVSQRDLLVRPCTYCSLLCAQRARAAQIAAGKAPAGRGRAWTPADDEELRRSYGTIAMGVITKRLRRSTAAIKARAAGLGLTRTKARPWTPEDDARLVGLLEENPWETIARRLGRTKAACQVRVKRLGHSVPDLRRTLTATHAAALLGLDPSTVGRWCRDGLLRARAITGQGHAGGSPGQCWAIEPADLRAFVAEHPGDVNLRRVGDMQVELIGLLTGRW